MPELIRPELNELSFLSKMLGSRRTMDWCGSTISFPKDKWADFYKEYVEADPKDKFFRLIYCPGCNDFVGAVCYQWNQEFSRYDLGLLIDAGKRFCGYGRWALEAIKKTAAKSGISSLWVTIQKNNTAIDFLEKYGFVKEKEDGEILLEYCELSA
jgi:GNAT superfamily N-acetyltransferase